MLATICNLTATLFSIQRDCDVDLKAMVVVILGLGIVSAPIELGQLAVAVLGAGCYVVLQKSRKVQHPSSKNGAGAVFAAVSRKQISTDSLQRSRKALLRSCSPTRVSEPEKLGRTLLERTSYHASSSCRELKKVHFSSSGRVAPGDKQMLRTDKIAACGKTGRGSHLRTNREVNPAGKQECRQVSAQPVMAPTFVASDLDHQIQELLAQISPSAEGDKLVQDISCAVKAALNSLIPEADVMGFATGDVLRGTAFAVAIPEVDIVLSVEPNHAIAESLRRRASRPLSDASHLDARTLQKSLLRACTDELAAAYGFKFRRSGFRSQEPKVTFIAEIRGRSIPIDFSVNTTTPLYNAALLIECGHMDPRAKELILLVRRWAKDRGVSHAAKGHLSPYAWSLLVIYFLQVWGEQGRPILPSVTSFKVSAGLLRKQQKEQSYQPTDIGNTLARVTSVACLFEHFIHFYTKTFNWRHEAVSVRTGTRRPPSVSLHLHIVTLECGAADVAPSVEDPFAPKRNLSEGMTGITLVRLREELARAEEILARRASLSELLEPWMPPEQK